VRACCAAEKVCDSLSRVRIPGGPATHFAYLILKLETRGHSVRVLTDGDALSDAVVTRIPCGSPLPLRLASFAAAVPPRNIVAADCCFSSAPFSLAFDIRDAFPRRSRVPRIAVYI